MITATHDLILLNRRLEQESRRDVYIATQISGVSFYHKQQSTRGGNYHEAETEYKIRIPIDAKIQGGRSYLPESVYDRLEIREAGSHWTIHTEDMLIICASPLQDVHAALFESAAVTEQEARAMADSVGLMREPVRVVEYSDNTRRGGGATRHWRIGGA